MQEAAQILHKLWGYPGFRPQQLPIVEAIAGGRDVLAILPTGGGKSVTFQISALLCSGTTLVVTPLVALMEDQVSRLRAMRIAAACLHGELSAERRSEVLKGIGDGRWSLLYLSPETLLSPAVWPRLLTTDISRIVLDEAHCLVSWGSSFRPSYHRLGAARLALGAPPLCALTATATAAAAAKLERLLGLIDPVRLVQPPYRANLFLQVRWMWSNPQRLGAMRAFLATCPPDSSGLIYLRTRAGAEQLARQLASLGYRCTHYHAGLAGPTRRAIERDWLAGRQQFLLATNAFGMGVDAPHVRWVIHANTPPSLEEYLQEIGRAGRDGEPATALLLASEPSGLIEPSDHNLHRHFHEQQQRHWQQARQALAQLPARGAFRADLALSLALLHECGQLVWETPFVYRITQSAAIFSQPAPTHLLRSYLLTRHCRWQFLLSAFGQAHSAPCGHCDRCCRTLR